MQFLDHLVWAAPNLDQACAAFEGMTGVAPAYGGKHGTGLSHNALVSFDETTYLEIFAPVEGASSGDEWVELCASLEEPKLLTYCLSPPLPLSEVARRGKETGLVGGGPDAWSRTRPDGVVLEWELYEPEDPGYGGAFPFFIDWQDSPHPAASAPSGLDLVAFQVTHPDAKNLSHTLNALGCGSVDVRAGDAPSLTAALNTPNGPVTLR